jgi:hypothetical protein
VDWEYRRAAARQSVDGAASLVLFMPIVGWGYASGRAGYKSA